MTLEDLSAQILVALYANPSTDVNDHLHNLAVASRAASAFLTGPGQVIQQAPQPEPRRATNKTVQWALNRLRAAAGQPNRDLVRQFLFKKGWVGAQDEPDLWNLDFVPTTKTQVDQLAAEIVQFDQERHKPAPVAV